MNKPKYPSNLYRRGDSWVVDFYYRGQRYTENIGPVSRTRAKEKRDQLKGDAAAGRLELGTKVKDIPFPVAIQRYLDWYRTDRARKSWERHSYSSKHLKVFFGNRRLSAISAFQIERYKKQRRDSGAAAATVNRELTLLKHLFNRSIVWGFLKRNPMLPSPGQPEGVSLFREDNSRDRYLTAEEAQRLLDACPDDLRLVVMMAMHTGFRTSELRSLDWSKVDFGNGSVTVQSAYSKNRETRTVPLSPDLEAMLRKVYDERRPDPDDLILTRNGKPWKDWRGAFKGALERAGISDFRFHDNRHCFGSWLAMSGTTGKAQMELMGHKDPQMTMRYTHLSVEHKRQAVGRLPSLAAKPEAKSQQKSQRETGAKVIGFSK